MTAVYVDELLAVNLLSDLAVLRITEKLTGRKIRKALPLFVGSVLGILSVFLPVPKLLSAAVFILASFRKRTDMRNTAYLLFSAAVLGGIVTGAGGGESFLLFTVVTALSSLALPAAIPRTLRNNAGYYDAEIRIDEKRSLRLRVMTDTGCTVRDISHGRSVLIVNRADAFALFTDAERRSAVSAEALHPPDGESDILFYPLPCRTVSGAAYLASFHPRCVVLNGRKRDNITVCLSQTEITGPCGVRGLYGAET